jgi:DNA polymerase
MTTKGDDYRELAVGIRNYLEYLSELGVDALPRITVPSLPTTEDSPAMPAEKQLPTADETLDDIRRHLGDCTRCPLSQHRRSIVFGEGPADADLVFVGEGPGQEEDESGRPFVGRAGQMLTDIIVKGMKMRREDVYISNIVKCRPPDNREPEPTEADTCLPFLLRQVRSIQPTVIVALGRVAAHYLLDTRAPLGRLRHRFHDLDGIPVMPTFHPSALLRFPNYKRDTWEDIKMVMAKLSE